jgi:hypothetical protein
MICASPIMVCATRASGRIAAVIASNTKVTVQ